MAPAACQMARGEGRQYLAAIATPTERYVYLPSNPGDKESGRETAVWYACEQFPRGRTDDRGETVKLLTVHYRCDDHHTLTLLQ